MSGLSRARLRAAGALGTLAVMVGGVGVVPATMTGAEGRTVETTYGFQGTAYGTRVTSEVAALESGKSAYAYIACTRLAGKQDEESVAALNLPADDPMIQADGIRSWNRTYRQPKGGIDAGVTSVNEIANLQLGNAETPRLTLSSLRSRSTAWATMEGKLRAENKVTALDIDLVNLEGTPAAGSPLEDLVDAVDGGLDQVVQTLVQNGETEIPGLGKLSFGYDRVSEKANFAVAGSFVLRVLLYGPDQVEGGGDDSVVGIGHSRARINRDLPAAVMVGVGYGASASVLDGVLTVGMLGEQPLPCRGTEGTVLTSPTADLDLGAQEQLVATALEGSVAGRQFDSGRAWAWTQGKVASLTLGPLEITGIRGRAYVEQDRTGKVVKKNIGGSTIGRITVDGEPQGEFPITPANEDEVPALELPEGVAKIDFFVTEKGTRGVETSAVVITFLDGTQGVSTLRLGNAKVALKR